MNGSRTVYLWIGILWMGIFNPVLGAEPEKRCESYVPMRAITQEPKSHWFSYYDKLQFDASGRYVLGMEVDFDDRAPLAGDEIRLGMVDLQDHDKWIEFGVTRAWSWQQGCMLQWIPGSDSKVIYNIRRENRFASTVQDVFSGEKRILDRPIYAVSPNGKQGVSLNFARLDNTRPGYGYVGVDDPWADQNQTNDDGIYLVDLESGDSRLILSLHQIASLYNPRTRDDRKSWFNHLLFNTDGSRFIFLHRWFRETDRNKGWYTRMFTARPDGGDIFAVADHDMVSHFIWRNPSQILAWSTEADGKNHFHLYDDLTDRLEIIGDGILSRDGHCTYSPDGKWIITDTYPDKERMQTLMLYRPSDSKLVVIGKFYLAPEFKGQTRCDLHARWSRDGKSVCIDSLHSGRRQMYLLNVSEIVK
jgi:hypothetical protein